MTHLQHADFADDADILSWIPSDHLHARHSKQAPLLALNQMAGYIYIKTEKRGNIIRYCPAHRGSRIACTRRNSNEIPTPIWTIVIRIGMYTPRDSGRQYPRLCVCQNTDVYVHIIMGIYRCLANPSTV